MIRKRECLQSSEKIFSQKIVIFCKNSVIDKIQFSQKSLINWKNQPHILPQQVLVQQTPIIFCCYYKPPHEVAGVPKKDAKILKERAPGNRSSSDQNESPNTRAFKRAIVGSSGTRSCGDIDDLKNYQFF